MDDFPYDDILAALRSVVDPELGIDLVELGLVREVVVDGDGVEVTLSRASALEPDQLNGLADDVESALRALPGLAGATVRFVDDPTWTPDRLSADARRALGG